MKIYRVITERDGQTTKAPGGSSTEIVRLDYYYGADSISAVWDAIAFLRNDPEVDVLGIALQIDAVTVLGTGVAP